MPTSTELPYRKLLWIFSALLLAVNALFFSLYQASHHDLSFATQLWNYVESTTFKVISGTFILPIIFILIENQFKLISSIREKNIENAEKRIEEKRKRRYDAVHLTISTWNHFFGLINELRFCEISAGNNSKKRSVGEIHKDIISSVSMWEEVINSWLFQFPKLRKEEPLFLVFINILMQAASSTAYLLKGEDEKDAQALQNALGPILEGIKGVFYHNLISVLKLHVNLYEIENEEVWQVKKTDSQPTINEINIRLGQMKSWAEYLIEEEFQNNPLLSIVSGEDAEEIRNLSLKIVPWLQEKKMLPNIGEAAEFPDLKKSYTLINPADKFQSVNQKFSKEFIFKLAQELSFQTVCDDIRERADNKGLVIYE